MSAKIKKAVLKKARNLMAPLISGEADRLEGLLAAAAVVGLSRKQRYQWIQPPPPHTGLSWVEGSVMLAFRPESSLPIHPDPTGAELEAAEAALTDMPEEHRESLECLALKALEGNLEWSEPPQFQYLDP